MARVKIRNVGEVGIITDLASHELPPNAWTSGQNVRFLDKYVEKMKGYEQFYLDPLHDPYYLHPIQYLEDKYWVLAGNNRISAYKEFGFTDITRDTDSLYAADTGALWSGCVIGGILVLNNKSDRPQYWATPDVSVLMQDMPNWPTGYRANTMASYKQHLFALGVTQNGVEYPHRILWSDVTDPGAVPASWDISDATRDAGQTELGSVNAGRIMRGIELHDTLIIYKNNSIWQCTPSRDNFIFNFKRLFSTTGLAAQNGVIEIPRLKQHFLYTGEDLVVHNGTEMRSVLTEREKRQLLTDIAPSYAFKSFMVLNPLYQEVWFCYTDLTARNPNRVVAYNYDTGILSHRNLEETPYAAFGYLKPDNTNIWNEQNITWDNTLGTWNGTDTGLLGQSIISARLGDKLNIMEQAETINGQLMTSSIERLGMTTVGFDSRGTPIQSLQDRKIIRRIWPHMQGQAVDIQVITQDAIGAIPTYSNPMPYEPSSNSYLDLPTPMNGLLYGIKVTGSIDGTWRLHGYDLELEAGGTTRWS